MPTTRPEDQLLRMLEQTLVPPTSVTELDPDTVDAATSRIGDVRGSLAESYLLNSHHTPASLNRLPDAATRASIRTFFFETTLSAFRQLLEADSRWTMEAARLPGPFQRLLSPLWTDPVAVDALYSVDVLVLVDDALWRCVPGAPGLMFERAWTPAQRDDLLRAATGASRDAVADAEGLVFVVGHLARTSYLTGDRAVRSLGLAAGAVVAALVAAGGAAGLRVGLTDVFVDATANRALSCDGLERSLVGILAVTAPPVEGADVGVGDGGATLVSRQDFVLPQPAVGDGGATSVSRQDFVLPQPAVEGAEDLVARWSALPERGRAAVLEVVGSAEDVVESGREASLGRVCHRVFERAIQEFFTAEQVSTQLPDELVRHTRPDPGGVPLPEPDDLALDVTLAEALAARRSVRSFDRRPLSLVEVSSVLGQACGRNGTEDGYGTRDMPLLPYPSIGGLDSCEVGVVAQHVEGLEPGYYVYDKVGHALVPQLRGDLRLTLVNATFESQWLFYAPLVLVLVNDQRKVAWKYKTRGYRISHLDQGALLQTLALTVTARGLGSCAVAGYLDEKINQTFGLTARDAFVTALLAVGRPNRLGHGV